jgi:hypothetical protein
VSPGGKSAELDPNPNLKKKKKNSLISHILNKFATFVFQGYNILGAGGSFLIFTINKNPMT